MALRVESVQEEFAKEATQRVKAMVAGPPGAGKTRFASTWPHVLYLDAEGRMLSVRDRPVHRIRITSLGDLEEAKAMLDQRPEVRETLVGVKVDTVVIDTVDEVARIVIKERLRSEKLEAMRMQDWGYLSDTLRNLLRGFRNLDLNVLFNVHLKSSEDSETGRVMEKPAIQGAVGDEIAAYVDEAFLLVARPTTDPATGERIIARHLQTYPDPMHDWVKDHSGALPLEFPVNLDDDYERISKLIFGSITAPTATSTIATSDAGVLDRPDVVKVAEPPAPPKRGGKKVPSEVPLRRAANGRAATVAPVTDVQLPESDPEPAPEPLIATPEAPAAPEPDAAPAEPPVPEKGTEPAEDDPLADLGNTPVCSECGAVIDPPDYAEFSEVRFGVPLCRTHFTSRNKKR